MPRAKIQKKKPTTDVGAASVPKTSSTSKKGKAKQTKAPADTPITSDIDTSSTETTTATKGKKKTTIKPRAAKAIKSTTQTALVEVKPSTESSAGKRKRTTVKTPTVPAKKPRGRPRKMRTQTEEEKAIDAMYRDGGAMPNPVYTIEDQIADWRKIQDINPDKPRLGPNIEKAISDLLANKHVYKYYQDEKGYDTLGELDNDIKNSFFITFIESGRPTIYSFNASYPLDLNTNHHHLCMRIRPHPAWSWLIQNPSTIKIWPIFDTGCTLQTILGVDQAELGITPLYQNSFETVTVQHAAGECQRQTYPVQCQILSQDGSQVLTDWFDEVCVTLPQAKGPRLTGSAIYKQAYWGLMPDVRIPRRLAMADGLTAFRNEVQLAI